MRLISLYFAVLLATACGEGGGIKDPEPPPVTELHHFHVHRCFDGKYVDSPVSRYEALEQCAVPPTCGPDEAAIPDSEIWDFLKVVSTGAAYTLRWAKAPEVRLADNLTEKQREVVFEAVSRLNDALPERYELQVVADVVAEIDVVPDGYIYVDFAPVSRWKDTNGASFEGNLSGYKGIAIIESNRGVVSVGRFWVEPENISNSGCPETSEEGRLLWTVTHEFLHILGFYEHPPIDYEQVSVLPIQVIGGPCFPDITIPGPMDCAALRKLYELAPRTPLDDISNILD